MSELLLCPFCGGEARLSWHGTQNCSVRCTKCGADHPHGNTTQDEAINRWNTRADSYPRSDPQADYEAER